MSRRSKIPNSIKDFVWRRDCGNMLDSNCTICNAVVSYTTCHVAHRIAVKYGGTDDVNNLQITCLSCNLSMGVKKTEEFKAQYFAAHWTDNYYNSVFKIRS